MSPPSRADRGTAGATGGDRETVAGLARGLAVIQAFRVAGSSAKLSEIAAIAGLSPATARRCLRTLEDLGYAGRSGRQFFLLPRVLDLSTAYLDSVDSHGLATDFLQDIVAASGNSASLAVLDGSDILYLAHAGARRVLRIEAAIGTRYPAYCTSMGRVLLSALDDDRLRQVLAGSDRRKLTRKTVTGVDDLMRVIDAAREDGFALAEDQLAVGVLSIAVPVRDRHGAIIAAINCSAQTGEVTQRSIRKVLPVLQETSARITGAIHHFPGLTNMDLSAR